MYKSFRDMDIWQNAMDCAENIFKLTDNLPRKEDYGFTSQIRRSALSISANIAEAFGRSRQPLFQTPISSILHETPSIGMYL